MLKMSILKNKYFWIVISFIIVIPIILYLIFKKSNVKCDPTKCDPTGGSCDSTGKCNCNPTGGSCDSSTGKCNCNPTYYGPNCSVKCDSTTCGITGG